MPSAGQTTDEATIVKVNVKVGDTVKRGDELLEAETDKAILPVESFAAGTVLDVLVQEGDAVTAGSVLAVIGKAEDAAVYRRGGGEAPAPEAAPVQEAPAAPAEREEYLPIVKGQTPKAAPAAPAPAAVSAARLDLPAMPNAKMLARELGVDIGTVPASNGVFVKRQDVEQAAKAPKAAPAVEAAPAEEAEYEVMPMTRMRTVIGRRMQESMQNIHALQRRGIVEHILGERIHRNLRHIPCRLCAAQVYPVSYTPLSTPKLSKSVRNSRRLFLLSDAKTSFIRVAPPQILPVQRA